MNKKVPGFNIANLFKPLTSIALAGNVLYLHTISVGDLEVYSALDKQLSATEKLRAVLPRLASLEVFTNFKQKRPHLPAEITAALTDNDLTCIAEAYLKTGLFLHLKDSDTAVELSRLAGETAPQHFIRLVEAEIAVAGHHMKHHLESLSVTTKKMFDPVRASAAALETTLQRFNSISKPVEPKTELFQHPLPSVSENLRRHQEQLADERAQDVERAQITSQMTAESARLLQELSVAATAFIEKFDQRSAANERAAKSNLRIAVVSVAVTAIFSVFAAWLSWASFHQDAVFHNADTTAQQALEKQLNEYQLENKTLQDQVNVLQARVDKLLSECQSSVINAAAPTAKRAPKP